MEPVTLKTQRLLLRPIGPDDLLTTHAYAGNPQNAWYMFFLPYASMAETRDALVASANEWASDAPTLFDFAVELDGRHIGGVSITLDASRTEGELAWIFHMDYWHKGYALEAAAALRDWGFQTLHLRRIFAMCDARNTASSRLMERLGMTLEDDTGTRCNRSEPDKVVPELVYGMTAAR